MGNAVVIKGAAASVPKARREGDVLKANAAKERAASLADRANGLTRRAIAASDAELRATSALRAATAAHLESKQWETRELVAYRPRGAVVQASAARKRALARGKKFDPEAEAQFARSVEDAEKLKQKLGARTMSRAPRRLIRVRLHTKSLGP